VTPLETLAEWLDAARRAGVRDADAMALATAAADGRPSVRIVYCRGIDGQGIRFFTNYASRKGTELLERPYAAAVFHWAATSRQVRIEGDVERLAAADSDAYFQSRPRDNQLSAVVSPQSAPIESLEILRERKRVLHESLEGRAVERPLNWGGYSLLAQRVEFWTSGEARLHDRVVYERVGGGWSSRRLAP
jgi:pyridoxamine 5'-phosphate oxidase